MYCLCASVEMTAYSFMVVLGLGGVFWDFVKRMGTGLYERTFAGQYAWQFADYCAGKLVLMFVLLILLCYMHMDSYKADVLCYRLQKNTQNNLE